MAWSTKMLIHLSSSQSSIFKHSNRYKLHRRERHLQCNRTLENDLDLWLNVPNTNTSKQRHLKWPWNDSLFYIRRSGFNFNTALWDVAAFVKSRHDARQLEADSHYADFQGRLTQRTCKLPTVITSPSTLKLTLHLTCDDLHDYLISANFF